MVLGCPSCRAAGKPANLSVQYDFDEIRHKFDRAAAQTGPRSMWRYADLLPVSADKAVTLGEGLTPLIAVPRLGRRIGVPKLLVKDETRNPTWSFKDRLASSAVSWAVATGKQVVTGSSSGNAGSAIAAFAARAGIPCVLFTTQQFPTAMKAQMAVYGSKLLAAPSIADRWSLVEAAVEEFGWFPITVFTRPLIGSNCFGIEGYKTIAFEIADELGRAPDHLVFPVGAGDAFFGTWKGFQEYASLGFVDGAPKMHAAEIFGPLQNALERGLDFVEDTPSGPTIAISVGLNMSTFQALHVLRASGGSAHTAHDDSLLQVQSMLAADEGLYVEASSALSLAVVKSLAETGTISPDEVVVAFLTSSGLKDPDVTLNALPPIPTCEANLESAVEALRAAYNFSPTDTRSG
jgi:threonine synthase